MLPLILATAITLGSTLPLFDEFLRKAEIDVGHPLTEKVITKRIVDPEADLVNVWIKNRYVMDCFRGNVRVFTDRDEDVYRMTTKLDPAEMKKWSEQPCVITETDAQEIAQRLFQRLGFKATDFEKPEVNRFRWQPSESNPNHVLWFPAFHIRWLKKGFKGEHLLEPKIMMVISGTTKKLIHFDATSLDVKWSRGNENKERKE